MVVGKNLFHVQAQFSGMDINDIASEAICIEIEKKKKSVLQQSP
jgi:hypothetical protein